MLGLIKMNKKLQNLAINARQSGKDNLNRMAYEHNLPQILRNLDILNEEFHKEVNKRLPMKIFKK